MGLRDFTVWSTIARNAIVHGERPALRQDGTTLDHRAYREASEDIALRLPGLGIGRGDRVAVLAENSTRVHLLFSACSRLGSIVVPLNWRLAPEELRRILADCEPAVLFADDTTFETAQSLASSNTSRRLATLGAAREGVDAFDTIARSEPGSLGPPPTADDTFLLIYTAAVDGFPRGAMISHANMVAAAAQLAIAIGFGPTDVFLANLPLFHIMGVGFGFAVQFVGGASIVRPRFDAADAATSIARDRVTAIGTFPPMLGAILDAAAAGRHDLGSLRAVIGLEAPAMIERLEHDWPDTRFWTGFGQTETTGMVTMGQARANSGSAGPAGMLCETAIADEADRPVPADQVGEIVVRGPTVMRGYWRRDDETAVIFRDGFHHTGDLGRIAPDGNLHYVGRSPARNLIKTGGENVFPAEVEQVMLRHPAVSEAVVFGIPDPHWGEAVIAVVVADAQAGLDAEALSEFVAAHLARYKRPRAIHFVSSLPKDANGRLDRAGISAEYKSD